MTWTPTEDVEYRRATRNLRLRAEAARATKLEAEAGMAGEAVVTEQDNRRLRNGIAVAALVLMAVVLVVVGYLFPAGRRRYA